MSLKNAAVGGSGRAKEYAKLGLRGVLHRRNLDLVRNPFPVRVARALSWLGVVSILDVGANIGQYGSALRAGGYTGRIVSCEPLQDAYAHLVRRSDSDPGWTALRTAVGAAVGTLELNVAANSYSSSALPMADAHLDAAPGSRFIRTEQVPVTTVVDLIARYGASPTSTLLKVDTQGFEDKVLDGAGTLLGQFAAIQLELSFVPLYEGQQLWGAHVQRLSDLGFAVYGLEAGFGDPHTGRMLQCDGLFVRTHLHHGMGNSA